MIESHTSRRFREAYAKLPDEIRQQARQAFSLFRVDPHHPSLRFKKVDNATNTYSVRVGLGYRALGVLEGSKVIWNWIGSHGEYDRLI